MGLYTWLNSSKSLIWKWFKRWFPQLTAVTHHTVVTENYVGSWSNSSKYTSTTSWNTFPSVRCLPKGGNLHTLWKTHSSTLPWVGDWEITFGVQLFYLEVSGGIPKSSILVGLSIINYPAIGDIPFMESHWKGQNPTEWKVRKNLPITQPLGLCLSWPTPSGKHTKKTMENHNVFLKINQLFLRAIFNSKLFGIPLNNH